MYRFRCALQAYIWFVVSMWTKSAGQITVDDTPRASVASHCLRHVLNTYNTSSLTVISPHEQYNLTEHYIQQLTSIICIRYMPPPGNMDKLNPIETWVALLMVNASDIATIMQRIKHSPNTKFIVVVSHDQNVTKHVQEFAKRAIIHVIVLVIDRAGEQVSIQGYTPFTKSLCYSSEVIELGTCTQHKLTLKRELYSERLDMCQCTGVISYMNFVPWVVWKHNNTVLDGIEGRMMNVIVQTLNMTPVYKNRHETEWGSFYPVPTGLLGDLHNGTSEMGFGTLFNFVDRAKMLDVSTPHNVEECLAWVVPKGAGKTSPIWLIMFLTEFDLVLWSAITFTFILTFISFRLFSLSFHNTLKQLRTSYFIYTFSSFIGAPVVMPRSHFLRIFLLSWVMFSFIITTAYQSAMSSRLTAPSPLPDIQTIKELADSSLHLAGPYNALVVVRTIASALPGTATVIADNFEVVNETISEILQRMVRHRDIAFFRHARTFMYFSLLDEKAIGKIHILEECVYLYYPWVLLRKQSPLSPVVNRVVQALNEAGIMSKWKAEILPNIKHSEEKAARKLRVSDVQAVFMFLACGLLAACCAFVVELICKSRCKKKTKTNQ